MQQPEIKIYLQDIIISIDAIKTFTTGVSVYEDFIGNRMLYRATERELEIVAEAITRIKRIDENIS